MAIKPPLNKINIKKSLYFIIFFMNAMKSQKIDELISVNGDFEKFSTSKFKSISEYKEKFINIINEIINSREMENFRLNQIKDTIIHEKMHLEEIIASSYIINGSFSFETIKLEFYKDNFFVRGATFSLSINENEENPSIRSFFISAAPLCPRKKDLLSTYYEISKAFMNGTKIKDYADSDIITMINVIGRKFIFSINKNISKEKINKFLFDKKNENNEIIKNIKNSINSLKAEPESKKKIFTEKNLYLESYILNLIANFFIKSKNLNPDKEMLLNLNLFLLSASETDKKYDNDIIFLQNINKIFLEEVEIILNSLDENYLKNKIASINLYKKFSKKLLYLALAKTCIKLIFLGEIENNGIYQKNTLMKKYPKTYQSLNAKLKKNIIIKNYLLKINKKNIEIKKKNKTDAKKDFEFKIIEEEVENKTEIKQFLISKKKFDFYTFCQKDIDSLINKIEKTDEASEFLISIYFGIIKFANTIITEQNCSNIKFIS